MQNSSSSNQRRFDPLPQGKPAPTSRALAGTTLNAWPPTSVVFFFLLSGSSSFKILFSLVFSLFFFVYGEVISPHMQRAPAQDSSSNQPRDAVFRWNPSDAGTPKLPLSAGLTAARPQGWDPSAGSESACQGWAPPARLGIAGGRPHWVGEPP